jgi:hypothetical protein
MLDRLRRGDWSHTNAKTRATGSATDPAATGKAEGGGTAAGRKGFPNMEMNHQNKLTTLFEKLEKLEW